MTPGGGRMLYGHHLLSQDCRVDASSSAFWPTDTESGDAMDPEGRYRLGGL